MKYKIIIRPEAEDDLEEAFQWYEEQSPGLGLDFLRCIDAAFDIITGNPELYQKVYKNISRALPRRFPYGIFYIIEDDKVFVLAVLHAKRDPKLLKERDYKR
ncbi:MAG: type II toxin-antitoxin system RelE/ParE family toxin [Candidatus Aminicenantes bacterium]|jgi:plasmid stabilization system protein ParE